MGLRPPVEGEAGVVLPGDVRGVLDPQPAHHVAPDVHTEDGPSVGMRLGGVARQLDPARLAPPTHLDLGLQDDRVAGAFGHLDGLVGGDGQTAGRHGDAVASEILLALVLEQVH